MMQPVHPSTPHAFVDRSGRAFAPVSKPGGWLPHVPVCPPGYKMIWTERGWDCAQLPNGDVPPPPHGRPRLFGSSTFGQAGFAQWHEVLRWPHGSPGVLPAHYGWFYGPHDSAKWILQGLMTEAWLKGREAQFGLRNYATQEMIDLARLRAATQTLRGAVTTVVATHQLGPSRYFELWSWSPMGFWDFHGYLWANPVMATNVAAAFEFAAPGSWLVRDTEVRAEAAPSATFVPAWSLPYLVDPRVHGPRAAPPFADWAKL